MTTRGCKYPPDAFCYICGEFIKERAKKYLIKTSVKMCHAYHAYFGMPVGDQDKTWAPHFTCQHCKVTLESKKFLLLFYFLFFKWFPRLPSLKHMSFGSVIAEWLRGEKRSMKFSIPRIWREPTDHSNNCYFCMVDPTKRRKGKNARPIVHPDIPSSSSPVPHSAELPVPTPPANSLPAREDSSETEIEDYCDDACYAGGVRDARHPYFPNQADLNDLVRDLALSKANAELLTSRLKQWNLLDPSVKVTNQRKRHHAFSTFFTLENGLCFCNDVTALFREIGIPCNPQEWRLFIDSTNKSLKAVLLHNGNQLPSIPVAHSVHLKEEYQNVKKLLTALKYEEYEWEVIGDFKMVSFLMGLQGGYIKFPCYLCLFDSRDTAAHYVKKNWPQRTEFSTGRNNVKWEPLIKSEKVLMPPLHIKLGLMKQFVTALEKDKPAFKYLQAFFPRLSEAKVTAGIFIGPQIKKIMACSEFPKKLTRVQRAAWNSFIAVSHGFLGNHKADNYVQLVQMLIKNYGAMGCRMSLKVHMLDAHLSTCKDNLGAYSEEQGERFHQDIQVFERRYQGQYNDSMMGDYIWNLIRDSDSEYKRQSKRPHHF
jgi:hypothetical protein